MNSPRPPVRSVALVVASVSCSNSACVGLHRRARQVVPIVIQHGCSQVSGDLVDREILAGLMANPNVSRSVVIGLGCEANQADELADRAHDRGGSVAVVGIQSAGGVDEAIESALQQLETGPQQGAGGQQPVRVGVMADESSGEAGANIAAAVAEELAGHGLAVMMSSPAALPDAVDHRPAAGRVFPRCGARGEDVRSAVAAIAVPEATAAEVREGSTDVERLTALAVCGAEVTVVVTGSASPIGSPVAPTVKLSCVDELDVLDDIIDVPFLGGDQVAQRTLAAVVAVIAGELTNAERGGARDIALWRIAPYLARGLGSIAVDLIVLMLSTRRSNGG